MGFIRRPVNFAILCEMQGSDRVLMHAFKEYWALLFFKGAQSI